MWKKENPVHCWWECKLVCPLWKTVWMIFLKKIKIKLPYAPASPLLDICSKEMKALGLIPDLRRKVFNFAS